MKNTFGESMKKTINWKEIKKQYPNQWVSLVEVENNEDGTVRCGVVVAHGPDVGEVTAQLKKQHRLADRLEYTGTIKNFLGFGKWAINDVQAK